jgi:predicted AAA+ superfamily ATPase
VALSNAERVGKALTLLNQGLTPFIEREMRSVYGEAWLERAVESLRDAKIPVENRSGLDTQALLVLMWARWSELFHPTLGHTGRTYVSELREARNRWAHQEAFSSDDADRALDTAARLLTAISAPEAQEIERSKQELRRQVYEEQARRETRKVAKAAAVEGSPSAALRPWRDVITPHKDVYKGNFSQAQFAADLWQVYLGEGASSEYQDPGEFFQRTYLTEGLKGLLVNAIKRLAGRGGDPVIELQTNFGGGKTHAMLALYHLFSGKSFTDLPGLEPVLEKVGTARPSGVKRVVLVGNKISPGQPTRKPDGTVVRTLWGELAYQLGGRDAFELLRQADETSTNPGDVLRQLFVKYHPCLILIDEWVAYARQLHDTGDLPGGSFETHFTFAQNLTEAAKAAPNTLLVVSIPASEMVSRSSRQVSDIEVGGERGRLALERLKNAIGRLESAWRPATGDESFEIVRRRLFQEMDPANYPHRDAVVKAFMTMYRTNAGEFPAETREAEYERKLKAAYPIHPELFDRLYSDWSALEKFQRTRGVLRLMAAVIHELWQRQDKNLLVMPAFIPMDAGAVQSELTRYLEDHWVPVIEKDVDGPGSLPLRLDRDYPNLGRYSACRRVARTLYLGSAPTLRTENRGVTAERVKLGCAQPGETPSSFGDALRRLTDQATHLYVTGERYWYSTTPSVARLAQDRAGDLQIEVVWGEIKRRLQQEAAQRGELARIHVSPEASSDVPNEPETSLVILGPYYPHSARAHSSPARRHAEAILNTRGASARTYKNTLVFLAADQSRQQELEQATRAYVAWRSIAEDARNELLNLDTFQRNQATTKVADADRTVTSRLHETYQWLLAPGQPDPRGEVQWEELRLTGNDGLIARALGRLKNDDLLITRLAGTVLRRELDRIPLWRGDHVGIKQLAEDFVSYLYLPRLQGPRILVEAIKDGLALLTWEVESFAYADGYDAANCRYLGLRVGAPSGIDVNQGLLVHPKAAAGQLANERDAHHQAADPAPGTADAPATAGGAMRAADKRTQSVATTSLPKRFHGAAKLDPVRINRDVDKIAQEVIQHLSGLVGAELEITIEIHARFESGVPEHLVRTVTENCRTLRFTSAGFEEA